jgi:undecaprenyl-diphosphatase
VVNGLILLGIEWYAVRSPTASTVFDDHPDDPELEGVLADARLSRMSFRKALAVGGMQVLALAPGISRSGVATAAGMRAHFRRDDAVRFSFLLATPVILAAGALKLPDLFGPLGNGIRPQVLVGSLLAGVGAYVSVRWLTRWVHTNTLRPFGWYCIVAGLSCLVLFGVRGT